MLTTIEQKLSAIKAINEEITTIELSISTLHDLKAEHIDSIAIYTLSQKWLFALPKQQLREIRAIMLGWYTARKAELISQAEELMK